ncbi:MAG TPA: hypothetical protein VGW78_03060 [Candidatus Babeliales bacterium]|jgi:hypothetical protein|nr:hypothetical protein [Candidatus Babeliales bacterium]
MKIARIMLVASVSIMPLCADYITSNTLKDYEQKLMSRIDKIKTGLEYRWWLSWIPSTNAVVKLSEMAGETVTPTEWHMFPIFEGLNSNTLSQKFQSWFQKLVSNDSAIKTIDNLLVEGKKRECLDSDKFNMFLHTHMATNLFSNANLTIDQVNKKIKEVDYSLYEDAIFQRITCDSLYRELVLTVQS